MVVHEKLVNFYKGFKDDAHPMAILVFPIRFEVKKILDRSLWCFVSIHA